MGVSTPLLVLGLAMTAIGTALILLSFRPRDRKGDVDHRGVGVIFIGPIPIVFGGKGRWVYIGIAVVAVIVLLLLAASMSPDLIGW